MDGGVNVTLGLPIVRTSPDHGTAFDIAGKGVADPASLIAALRLAAELAAARDRRIAMTKLRLGVNIDHVATVRNARGGAHPDPLDAARAAHRGGGGRHHAASARGPPPHPRRRCAPHPRRDRRADQPGDGGDGGDGRHRARHPPARELPGARAAPGGHHRGRPRRRRASVEALRPVVAALREAGIRVSLFIDPDPAQLRAAAAIGAPVVELHTGAYADGRPGELDRLRAAAALTARARPRMPRRATGSTFDNVAPVAALPEVVELNIGHFLIGEAIVSGGLAEAVREMKRLMEAARIG